MGKKCGGCKKKKCCCSSSSSSSSSSISKLCDETSKTCHVSSKDISGDSSCSSSSSSSSDCCDSSSSSSSSSCCDSSSSSSSSCCESSSSSSSSSSCSSSSSSSSSSCSSSSSKSKSHHKKRKYFKVTLECKKDAPWEKRATGPDVFAVDDRKNATLHLRRGKKYYFKIKQEEKNNCYAEYFYFTKDQLGGKNDSCSQYPGYVPAKLHDTPEPMPCGVMELYVGKHLPSHFYYQSNNSQGMGGLVIVDCGEYDEGSYYSSSESRSKSRSRSRSRSRSKGRKTGRKKDNKDNFLKSYYGKERPVEKEKKEAKDSKEKGGKKPRKTQKKEKKCDKCEGH